MAAEHLPLADRPRQLFSELHVVALLRSYRVAMTLARQPPASLRLWRPLRWLHLRMRPRWACCYFTTRYVRGRADALERALAGRIAVGEADPNDEREAEAVARFKASLPPPPSRIFGIAGLIAAIVLAQVLISALLDRVDRESSGHFKKALGELGIHPDAQQFSDIGRALVAADCIQLCMIVTALAATLYLFGRPLASGYRLAYLCLGRGERTGLLRRGSPLHAEAARLETVSQEDAAVRSARADFRREMPIDLLVKTLPGLVVAFWLIAIARDGYDLQGVTAFQLAAWAAASLAIGAAGAWLIQPPRVRRRTARLAVHASCAVAFVFATLTIVGDPAVELDRDAYWFALATVVLARAGWLALVARSRRYPVWWVVFPLGFTCVLGIVSRWPANF